MGSMARTKEKSKAIKLRHKGKSINEIAERLKISKSTISSWCRNIELTSEHIKRLVDRQKSGSYKGRIKATEKKRRIRIREEKILKYQGIKEVGKINRRDLFIAGISAYWSEGYTHPRSDQVGFTNSDPKMILLILRWFKEICNISDDRFSLSIRINKIHKNRIKEIESYWSKLTHIPLSQFNKTILIRSNSKKIYPNHKNYYGTLRIIVRQGTKLRRKINGWIEGLTRAK